MTRLWMTIALFAALGGSRVFGQQTTRPADAPEARPLSLSQERTATSEGPRHTETTWGIVGPIRLRSADPEELGGLEIKNKVDYSTSSDGTDDDTEYELEIEYGIAENHELIFEVPVELGDGGVDGNADITLGWHWRLWKEQDTLPAFALRNYIRVPSGYRSSGVDYKLVGLLTKSIIPEKFRLHLNPFLESVNGDNEEDARDFQWGAIVGFDYKLADNLALNMDYVHETSESEGERNQHTAEVGLDWKFAEHQTLAFVTRAGLDGDGAGENFGCTLSYIWSFDNMPYIGK